MKKSIIVILKETGRTQSPIKRIKRVSLGHAFNYLIPEKKAEVATEGKIKHLNMLHRTILKNKNAAHNQNTSIKQILENINTIHIRKKCSTKQLIFGSISEQDISAKILQLTGQRIDKKQIIVNSGKTIGKYSARIILTDSLSTLIYIHILPKTI